MTSPFEVKPNKNSILATTPKKVKATKNFKAADDENKDAGMTFVMPREWHTEFKVTATMEGMSMRDLLIQSFEAWKREQYLKAQEAKK